MSVKTRDYRIRLSAQGKRELERYLQSIGKKGQGSLKRIEHAARPASAGLRAVNRASQGAAHGLSGLGRQVPAIEGLARVLGTTAIVTGLVRISTSSLRAAKDFQASMKRVKAATRATDAQMTQLEQKARAAGATTSFRASEAADAIEMLAKNGLRYQQIVDGALDSTLTLAAALGAELAPAADLTTDLMAQFGLQASDMAEIVDLVTGAALNSKFGFDDLRLAIGQAGGVAGSFGVEIGDFLTALAATSSAFSSGQDAGTSFKNFLQRLTPQGAQARAVMERLGLEFFDTAGNMKSLVEISEELREAVSGLSEEARNEALVRIFGTDAVRTAILLAERGADGIREIGAAVREVKAADQAAVRLQGLEGALKELASAWEALQLTAADEGGLDVAESAVRRLTDAIRFLNENFNEVNEVVERVAQALTAVLVLRGMRRATAAAVAMRASYIDLATSVTGVGTAAGRTAGLLSRAGIAARVVAGAVGGPFGLVMIAGALTGLIVDLDRTEDLISDAETASRQGASALEAFRQATADAADEQDRLGGSVSKATRDILLQARVEIQTSLRELRATLSELYSDALGEGWFNRSEVTRFVDELINQADIEWQKRGGIGPRPDFDLKTESYKNLTPAFQRVADLLKGFERGAVSAEELKKHLDAVGGLGAEVDQAARALAAATSGGDEAAIEEARARLTAMAEASGLFAGELERIDAAGTDRELTAAFGDLAGRMQEVADVGEVVRASVGEKLRALLGPIADAETKSLALEAALEGNWDLVEKLTDADNPFKPIEEGADSAKEKVDDLERSIKKAYHQYGQGRLAREKDAREASEKGLLALIRHAEGTAGRRGYNTTLDYGRWTGGPRNLTGMTLREIMELQGEMLANPDNRALYGNGRGSSALGAYQITRQTLRDHLIPELGLSGDELFDEALQDRMAKQLIRRRGGQGIEGLRNEWEGLRHVPDRIITSARVGTAIPSEDPQVAKTRAQRLEDQKRERELIDQLVGAGESRMAQLELESALVGKSAEEQIRLRYIFEALTEAKRKGIDVDRMTIGTGETLRQVIERQADALSRRTVEQERARQSELGKIDELMSARRAVEGAFEKIRKSPGNIAEAFGDMADYISRRLWNLALDPVFDYLADLIAGIFTGDGSGESFLGIPGLKAGGATNDAPAAAVSLPGFARGGLQSGGRAQGRIEGTGATMQDNILLLGSRGEFMMRASAVDYYGLDYMEKLNQMRLPKFADGGALAPNMPRPAEPRGGAAPLIGELNISVERSETGESDEQAQDLAAAIADRVPQMIDERIGVHARDDGLLGSRFQRRGFR